MNDGKPNFVAIPGGGEKSTRRTSAGNVVPSPFPGHNLDRTGLRIYDYLCDALIAAGRDVTAGAVQLVMVSHQLQAWSADMKSCVEEGRYGKSPKGGTYELPHSYNERNARDAILKALPEACLTIMSTIEAGLKESKVGGEKQDDLFASLLDHGKGRPGAAA